MKKINFISVFTIIALIGGLVLMNACSKQENESLMQETEPAKDYTVYYAF